MLEACSQLLQCTHAWGQLTASASRLQTDPDVHTELCCAQLWCKNLARTLYSSTWQDTVFDTAKALHCDHKPTSRQTSWRGEAETGEGRKFSDDGSEVSKASGPQMRGSIELVSGGMRVYICLWSWNQRAKLSLVAFHRLKVTVVSRHCKVCSLEQDKCNFFSITISRCI